MFFERRVWLTGDAKTEANFETPDASDPTSGLYAQVPIWLTQADLRGQDWNQTYWHCVLVQDGLSEANVARWSINVDRSTPLIDQRGP